MKLYNTMTRQVEEFKPLTEGQVTMYTCGPTVYLDPHIGNWRTFINYDLLSRVLTYQGYKVNHVLNITDVGHLVGDGDEGQDKMAKTATAQRKTAWEVAKHYTDVFLSGLNELNILNPSVLPKATDHIAEQIAMVMQLEELGYTYVIDDGVYYDTSKFSDYGKLSRANLEGQLAGARVEDNQQKRNPQDFALWKFSPKNEKRDMEWQSPWGVGFPGWHIECSAMALRYLGKTIDIHGGGIDHIPIHHTNEIAQSEAANQQVFANYWFHSDFMTVDGTKMSKSLGNIFTLDDIKKNQIDPIAYRLFVLQSHYRNESNFTWEALEASAQRLKHLNAFADLMWQTDELSQGESKVATALSEIEETLYNDLNTPQAFESLGKLINSFDNRKPNPNEASDLKMLLSAMDSLLGLNLTSRSDISDANKNLLKQRQEARDKKDWDKSDTIRSQLLKSGIQINDTPQGQIWTKL